jgi:hypothetical protein
MKLFIETVFFSRQHKALYRYKAFLCNMKQFIKQSFFCFGKNEAFYRIKVFLRQQEAICKETNLFFDNLKNKSLKEQNLNAIY